MCMFCQRQGLKSSGEMHWKLCFNIDDDDDNDTVIILIIIILIITIIITTTMIMAMIMIIIITIVIVSITKSPILIGSPHAYLSSVIGT